MLNYLITNIPCILVKVSTLSHYFIELSCKDYAFLDQAVEFEHDLDSILMDSIKTPELDASFD